MKASPATRGQTPEVLAATREWVVEEKIDGVRVFVESTGSAPVKLWSRSGQSLTKAFPEVVAGFGQPAQPFLLDGELQLLGQATGELKFQHLLSRVNTARPGVVARSRPAAVRAFDLLELEWAPQVAEPLYARRTRLERLVLGLDTDVCVLLPQGGHEVAPQPDRQAFSPLWADHVARVTASGRAEGLIVKAMESKYRPGIRSKQWIKFKFKHTVSCIAYSYEPSSNPRRPLGAVQLVMLDGSQPITVGMVGSGMSERDMRLIRDSIDNRQFLIVEIEVLGRTDDGLREPVFVGIRSDADVLDAPFDQMDTVPAL